MGPVVTVVVGSRALRGRSGSGVRVLGPGPVRTYVGLRSRRDGAAAGAVAALVRARAGAARVALVDDDLAAAGDDGEHGHRTRDHPTCARPHDSKHGLEGNRRWDRPVEIRADGTGVARPVDMTRAPRLIAVLLGASVGLSAAGCRKGAPSEKITLGTRAGAGGRARPDRAGRAVSAANHTGGDIGTRRATVQPAEALPQETAAPTELPAAGSDTTAMGTAEPTPAPEPGAAEPAEAEQQPQPPPVIYVVPFPYLVPVPVTTTGLPPARSPAMSGPAAAPNGNIASPNAGANIASPNAGANMAPPAPRPR